MGGDLWSREENELGLLTCSPLSPRVTGTSGIIAIENQGHQHRIRLTPALEGSQSSGGHKRLKSVISAGL